VFKKVPEVEFVIKVPGGTVVEEDGVDVENPGAVVDAELVPNVEEINLLVKGELDVADDDVFEIRAEYTSKRPDPPQYSKELFAQSMEQEVVACSVEPAFRLFPQ
jgi:hypothetical protein